MTYIIQTLQFIGMFTIWWETALYHTDYRVLWRNNGNLFMQIVILFYGVRLIESFNKYLIIERGKSVSDLFDLQDYVKCINCTFSLRLWRCEGDNSMHAPIVMAFFIFLSYIMPPKLSWTCSIYNYSEHFRMSFGKLNLQIHRYINQRKKQWMFIIAKLIASIHIFYLVCVLEYCSVMIMITDWVMIRSNIKWTNEFITQTDFFTFDYSEHQKVFGISRYISNIFIYVINILYI